MVRNGAVQNQGKLHAQDSEDLAGLPVPLLGTVPELNPARSWTRHTPLAWIEEVRNRDFARKTARSILAPEAARSSEGTER